MEVFKSKFNYPVLLLRAIGFGAASSGFIFFIVIGIPKIWNKFAEVQAAAVTLLGFLYIFYIVYMVGYPFLTQRFKLVIEDGKVYIKDVIFNRVLPLDASFKGYTNSEYGSSRAIVKFETLIFYLSDGRIIEFPQMLYRNFKSIKKSLEDNDIRSLGYEPFIWKNLVSRSYKYKGK